MKSNNPDPLLFNSIYYIVAKGIKNHPVFLESSNYPYFFFLMRRYLKPIANLEAYTILENEIHLILIIKKRERLNLDLFRYTTVEKPKGYLPSSQLSHLFNSYTQTMNKRYGSKEGMFSRPFKRRKLRIEEIGNLKDELKRMSGICGNGFRLKRI